MSRISFDRVADCYDATRALPPDALAAITGGIARALRDVAPAPSLLEVGVGTGRIAVPLATEGIRLTGIDIAPAMLAHLRAKRPEVAIALADATSLPFPSATFDGVLFVHILHLLPDPAPALRAAQAATRSGGILLYGRTDHAEHPRRQVIARARALVREIAGVDVASRERNHTADRTFADHARSVGAPLAQATLARWVEHFSGRGLLTALANRTYSSTWAISEAAMPELLRRLTPQVDALCGGLDRSIDSPAAFILLTARLPG